MLNITEDGVIQLTRGDTARLSVTITNDQANSEYEIADGDTLTLTVRKNPRDKTIVLQKSVVGSGNFYIAPEDTQEISFGKFSYDIQLTTAGGDVYTVITPNTFEILEEVTW